MTTLQIVTSDPSSGSICHLLRQLGFPVVGDAFSKREYYTLKRSIRNRLKDKLCIGCFKVDIDQRYGDDNETTQRPQQQQQQQQQHEHKPASDDEVITITKDIPEKLSALYWERFLGNARSSV
jgi:hypothetical protein